MKLFGRIFAYLVILGAAGCTPLPAPTPSATTAATDTTAPMTQAVRRASVTPTATGLPSVVLTAAPPTSQHAGSTANPPSISVPPTAQPGAPVILSFTVTPTEVDPGGQITFTWTSTGGASAIIFEGYHNGYGKRLFEVPTNGSLTVTTDTTDVYTHPFTLTVYKNADRFVQGLLAQADVRVTFICQIAAFYPMPPGYCPEKPAVEIQAAEQVFEQGRMLWLQQWWNVGKSVLVLRSDGSFYMYADTWQPGDPESDPTIVPPEGMFQPVRGFGKVWREQSGVRSLLGWAVGPEQGYVTPMQHANPIFEPGTDYNYLLLSDGRAIYVIPESYSWAYLIP